MTEKINRTSSLMFRNVYWSKSKRGSMMIMIWYVFQSTVPCGDNLVVITTNSFGDEFDANNGSTILIDGNGRDRTLSCVTRGARGLDPEVDKPHLEILIKENGEENYMELSSLDGIEVIRFRIKVPHTPHTPLPSIIVTKSLSSFCITFFHTNLILRVW